MTASFLVVHGKLQREGEVIHLVAQRFTDLSARLRSLRSEGGPTPRPAQDVRSRLVRSRDFH
jgi:error-prone DNA polymerase